MQRLKINHERLNKIRPAQFLRHLRFFLLGALSWLGFSYLFVLYTKMSLSRSIYVFPWHYDAPIWVFRECLMGAAITILVKWKFKLLSENSKNLLRDFIILIALIPVNAFLIKAFHMLVLGVTYTAGERPPEFDWVVGFLSGAITQTFVSMTCIGYFYLTLVNTTKEKLSAARQARNEMELKTLRQNIEPHFLFNNLNVLSALIESNPTRANEFLSKMSELYRYILRTQNLELVPVGEELEFVENYVFLLRERFGTAYNFDWRIDAENLNGQMLVPVSLQNLIENAVKHNSGNADNPLRINIRLEDEYLSVENELRAKRLTFPTNQSGLDNLRNRYAFLTEKPLEISQNDSIFKVKLPLLHVE